MTGIESTAYTLNIVGVNYANQPLHKSQKNTTLTTDTLSVVLYCLYFS